MTDARDRYPQIQLAGTDTELPASFKNNYQRYSDFAPLAGGGHGVLRSCYDHGLNRWVAMKTLQPKSTKDPAERRRLIREARVSAQLQHPNTVPVYELGINLYGDLYFTMKRIEGANLFELIRARAAMAEGKPAEGVVAAVAADFSLDRLLGTLVQASNALHYAHTHGVIHRDVKPENILVGTYGEVYLMDWGVAFVRGMANDPNSEDLDDEILFERLTVTGKRPGTPLYMSPEQIAGNPIDQRTDIFSMGVVLYESLATHEPFRGATVQETFENIRSFDPEPPSAMTGRRIPRELDRICLMALAKDPDQRYQSAAEFVADIGAFRDRALSAT